MMNFSRFNTLNKFQVLYLQCSTFSKIRAWSEGPIVYENCWSGKKVSGPSQDEFVEYMIYNSKMQCVFEFKFGDNEMLLVQGTI